MVHSRYFSLYNTSESSYETSNRTTYRSVSPRYSNVHIKPSVTLVDSKQFNKNSNSYFNNPLETNRYYFNHGYYRHSPLSSMSSSNLNHRSVEIPIERVYSSRLSGQKNSRDITKYGKFPMVNLDLDIQTSMSDIKISRRSRSQEVIFCFRKKIIIRINQ